MKNEIFKSDRYFTVFDYSVSHGRLILRSDKRKGYKKNIDIVFFDTNFMQLFTMLYGVTIRLIDKNNVVNYNKVVKYLSHKENNLFELESDGEKYFIAASFVKVFENKLEFNETGLDGENKKKNREITGSC